MWFALTIQLYTVNLISLQILTVINPNIMYKLNALSKTNNLKMSGVGVSLKEFLLLLDRYGIDHEPESVLRLRLRRNKRIISRSKQFFLQSGSSSIAISRKSDDTKCKTCICIPRDSLPLSFFELFNNNGMIGTLNLICFDLNMWFAGETPSSTTCPSDTTQMSEYIPCIIIVLHSLDFAKFCNHTYIPFSPLH